MQTFLTRLASALVALAILFGVIFTTDKAGLKVLCCLVVVLATRELVKILFEESDSLTMKTLFVVCSLGLFALGILRYEHLSVGYGIAVVTFFSLSLFLHKKFDDLNSLAEFQARSLLGIYYLALLPTFATKLIDLDHGVEWFLFLLAVVFLGDTFAYLVGWKIGNRKLMPDVSPKKTIEGSLGGLLGSFLAALIFSYFLNHVSLWTLVGLALVVGAIGQMGDLFESLLKRVAHKKDSGSLMPGHGGVLDRIDGVLFAAPLMFAGAALLERAF